MDNIIMAENRISIVLRHANEGYDNNNEFNNWHIYALARPGESSWYTSNSHSWISNSYGYQMLTVTESGESFPFPKYPYIYLFL